MARLTAELSLQCSATALIGGDLVILARAGMPQSHEGLARVGERRLMIPPMGMCHAAWAGASIVEPYLAFAKQHLKAKVYARSEEHTSELQSLMRISYDVFCLKNKTRTHKAHNL